MAEGAGATRAPSKTQRADCGLGGLSVVGLAPAGLPRACYDLIDGTRAGGCGIQGLNVVKRGALVGFWATVETS